MLANLVVALNIHLLVTIYVGNLYIFGISRMKHSIHYTFQYSPISAIAKYDGINFYEML